MFKLYWDSSNHLTGILKAWQQMSWANYKHLLVLYQSGLQISKAIFIFVYCKLLFPRLVLLPVISFLQQIACGSGISKILILQGNFSDIAPSTHELLGSSNASLFTPMGLLHFSSSALCGILSLGWSSLLLLLLLVITTWYWHLQYTGIFSCN